MSWLIKIIGLFVGLGLIFGLVPITPQGMTWLGSVETIAFDTPTGLLASNQYAQFFDKVSPNGLPIYLIYTIDEGDSGFTWTDDEDLIEGKTEVEIACERCNYYHYFQSVNGLYRERTTRQQYERLRTGNESNPREIEIVWGNRAIAAVSVGNDSDSSGVDGTAVTSLTYALDVGAGSERAIVVGSGGFDSAGDALPTGITYNGDALASEGSQNENSGNISSIWCLANPDSGSNNVVVTLPASATIAGSIATAYTGANQTDPCTGYVDDFGSTGGTSFVVDVDVTSSTGDIVQDFSYASGATTISHAPGANQTELAEFTVTGATNNSFSASTEPGGTTITMSQTYSSASAGIEGYLSAINIAQSTGAATPTVNATLYIKGVLYIKDGSLYQK